MKISNKSVAIAVQIAFIILVLTSLLSDALRQDSSFESSEGDSLPSEHHSGSGKSCNATHTSTVPPKNIHFEPSARSVLIRWEPPPEECNFIIQGYKIRYRPKKGKRQSTQMLTVEGNLRMYRVEPFELGTAYQFRLAAISPNGTGQWSEWLTTETLKTEDLIEDVVPNEPNTLRVRASSTKIFVAWTPPKNSDKIIVRGYVLGWGIGVPDMYQERFSHQARSFTIQKVQPQVEYVIKLVAYNGAGEGMPSYAAVNTLPENKDETVVPLFPPIGLKAVVISPSSVILSWSDSDFGGGAGNSFTDHVYTVRYTNEITAPDPHYMEMNTTETQLIIDELTPATQYEFAVKAIGSHRESTWSMAVLNETQAIPPSSPPRDLTVVASPDDDPTVVNLHWQPPKHPNGQITGYVILFHDAKLDNDDKWSAEAVLGDRMTTVIRNLRSQTTYYFKIQARNEVGTGPMSQEVAFTTLADLPSRVPRASYTKHLTTETMYLLIAGITGVTVLLLMIVVVLLARSKRSSLSTSSYGGAKKKTTNGYSNANGQSPTKTATLGRNRGNPPDLWIHHNSEQIELKSSEDGNPLSMRGHGAMHGLDAMPHHNPMQHPHQHNPQMQHINDHRRLDSLYDDINNKSPSEMNVSVASSGGGSSTMRRNAGLGMNNMGLGGMNGGMTLPGPNTMNAMAFEPSTSLSRPMFPGAGNRNHQQPHFNIPRAHVTLDEGGAAGGQGGSIRVSHHHLYDPINVPVGIVNANQQQQQNFGIPNSNSVYGTNGLDGGSNTLKTRALSGNNPLKSFGGSNQPLAAPSPPKQITVRPQPQANGNQQQRRGPNNFSLPPTPSGFNNLSSAMIKNLCSSPAKNSLTETVKSEDLPPSCSTEELNQEMANLEGLMKDLNAITAKEFDC